MPTSNERTATEAPLLSPPLPDDHRYLSRGVSGGGGSGRGGRQGGRGKPVALPRMEPNAWSAWLSRACRSW